MSAVAEQQDQPRIPEISLLGSSPSYDRLDVVNVRFRLDHSVQIRLEDQGIHAPEITRCWHWDFGPESNEGAEPPAKASKERQMRGVADRRSRGVQAYVHVQPDHGREQDESMHIDRAYVGSLDSTDGLMGHNDPATQLALAQPCGDPSNADLLTNATDQCRRESPTSLKRRFSR